MGPSVLLTTGCILAVISVVLAQGPDNDLVRCNHELCPKICKLGQQTDKDGCFVCECLEDPCRKFPCKRDESCKKQTTCASDPCTHLDYTCEKAEAMPCPVPMCADFCARGLQISEYGCETCDCKLDACEGVECPPKHKCSEVEKPNMGPRGETGYTYACKPVDQEPMDLNDILGSYPDMPPLCSFRKEAVESGRLELLEHQQLEDEQIMLRKAEDVSCDADGEFNPLQCNTALKLCWCVTDAGRVVPGSKTKSDGTSDLPFCVPQVTPAVDIDLVLTHTISSDNMPTQDVISVAVQTRLSDWMQLDSELIEVKEVTPGVEEVTVSLTLHHADTDGTVSVAYLSEKLRWNLITGHEDLMVTIEQETLTPVPERIMLTPQASTKGYSGRSCFYSRAWHDHKIATLVVTGLAFLVLFVFGVLLVKTCTRQQKKANISKYQQNLHFSNELYGKEPKVVLDKEFLIIEATPPTKA